MCWVGQSDVELIRVASLAAVVEEKGWRGEDKEIFWPGGRVLESCLFGVPNDWVSAVAGG